MSARNIEAERRARSDRAASNVWTVLACLAFAALGIACIGGALHTTDVWIGRILFWGGLGMGNSGILFTLLAAYRRRENRGD
jgi:hypothetical protein